MYFFSEKISNRVFFAKIFLYVAIMKIAVAEANFIKIMTGSESGGNKTKEIILDELKGHKEKVWFSIEGQLEAKMNTTEVPNVRMGIIKSTNDPREVNDINNILTNQAYIDPKSFYADEKDDPDLADLDQEIQRKPHDHGFNKVGRQVPPNFSKHRKHNKKKNMKRHFPTHTEYNDHIRDHGITRLPRHQSRQDYDQDYTNIPSHEESNGHQVHEEYSDHQNHQGLTMRPNRQEFTEHSLYPDNSEVSKHVVFTGHQENTKSPSQQTLTESLPGHSKNQNLKKLPWHSTQQDFTVPTFTEYPNYYYYWESASAKQPNLNPSKQKATKRKSLQSLFRRQKQMVRSINQEFVRRPNQPEFPHPFNSQSLNNQKFSEYQKKRSLNLSRQKLEKLSRQLRKRLAHRTTTPAITTAQTSHTNQRIEISFVTQSYTANMELNRILATQQPAIPIIPLAIEDLEKALPMLQTSLQKRFSVVHDQSQVNRESFDIPNMKSDQVQQEKIEEREKYLQGRILEDKKYRVTSFPKRDQKRFEIVKSKLRPSKFYNTYSPPQIIHKNIYYTDYEGVQDNVQRPYNNIQRPDNNIERPDNNIKEPEDNSLHPQENSQHPHDNIEHPQDNSEHPHTNLKHSQDNLQHPLDNLQHPQENVKPYESVLGAVLITTEKPPPENTENIIIKVKKNKIKSRGKRKHQTKKHKGNLLTALERIVPIHSMSSYEESNKTSNSNNKDLKKILRKLLRNSKVNIDSLLQTISETNMIENITESIMQKMFQKLVNIKMKRIKQETKDLKSKVEKIKKNSKDIERLKHEAEGIIKMGHETEDMAIKEQADNLDSTEVIQIVVDKNGLVLKEDSNEDTGKHKTHKKHSALRQGPNTLSDENIDTGERHKKHNENRNKHISNPKHSTENKDKRECNKKQCQGDSDDDSESMDVDPGILFTKMR